MKPTPSLSARRTRRPRHGAFTLIEVAVASAILAIALFAIISLCTASLNTARRLNRVHVDASSLAAELSLSNRLEEVSDYGDFGNLHPGYRWQRDVYEAGTNGLFQADFVVMGGDTPEPRRLSIFLFRPGSPQGMGRGRR
jgi:prepilin-type N-terminal cleavage/methylation domain-containing protein